MAVIEETHNGSRDGRRRRSGRYRSSRSGTLTAMLGGLLGLAVFLLVGVSVTLGGRVTTLSKSNSALSDELFK